MRALSSLSMLRRNGYPLVLITGEGSLASKPLLALILHLFSDPFQHAEPSAHG